MHEKTRTRQQLSVEWRNKKGSIITVNKSTLMIVLIIYNFYMFTDCCVYLCVFSRKKFLINVTFNLIIICNVYK